MTSDMAPGGQTLDGTTIYNSLNLQDEAAAPDPMLTIKKWLIRISDADRQRRD
jgi:hypothetical protein